MATDLPLHCRCGRLRGVVQGVSPSAGNRIVCHCDDCQTWIHHLGGSDAWLDDHGGTELFQLAPDRIRIEAGADQLRCKRLRDGGLMRWYAACCDTPIANTLASAQLPFAGVVHACIDAEAAGTSRDAALGPIIARVFGSHAVGERDGLEAPDRAPFWLVLRILRQVLGWRLGGRHRKSPFFDARTGRPTAAPEVLAPEVLKAAQQARRRGA